MRYPAQIAKFVQISENFVHSFYPTYDSGDHNAIIKYYVRFDPCLSPVQEPGKLMR
jgi:hypothetical protein